MDNVEGSFAVLVKYNDNEEIWFTTRWDTYDMALHWKYKYTKELDDVKEIRIVKLSFLD